MKTKKIFQLFILASLAIILVGCQNKNSAPEKLRMAESINSSTQRIWFVCYTDQDKSLTPKTEVGGILVTKDAKITAYVTAASHKTLKDFNSKKTNGELINYAKSLSKKGAIGTAKKQSVIKKDNKVNLYMDMTGKKVAGEGIVDITAPDYFMTRVVGKTKVGSYNYAGLKDPRISGGTGRSSYYIVTRLDNPNQKFEFDKPNAKNTQKVYMKSYPKKEKGTNSQSNSQKNQTKFSK